MRSLFASFVDPQISWHRPYLTLPIIIQFQPACVEFKPEYIVLAKDTTMQFRQVEFFAVSCDAHLDVCKDFGIESFPTLKVFQAGHNSDVKGTEITNHDTGYTVELVAAELGLFSSAMERKLQERPEFNESPIYIEVENNELGDENEDPDETDLDVFDGDGDNDNAEIDQNDMDLDMDMINAEMAQSDGDTYEISVDTPEGDDADAEVDQSDVDADETSADALVSEDTNIEIPQSVLEERRDTSDEYTFYLSATEGVDNDEDGSRDDSDENADAEMTLPKLPIPGAMLARYKKKDLDRFQEQLKRNVEIRKRWNNRRRKGLEPADPDSMTKAMRVNTPGTEEFINRRKAMLERLEKARKKGIRLTKPLQSAENSGAMELGELPYYKDIRKRRRFASLNPFSKLSEEEQLILDVTNAFYMGLKMGLFLKNDQLSPPQIIAFRNYLELLSVSLPPEWRLHKLIGELRRNFVKVGRSREYLYEILEKYPIQVGWSKDCLNGGFSCGFWKLLHTATVGLAEQRGGLNLIDSELIRPSAKTFSPMEAADTIRNYIDHFFTCGPCRDEFIKNYDYCDKNRRCDRLADDIETATIADWKELATWLWEVHNEVSVRVVNTRAKKMHDGLSTKKEVVVPVTDEIKALWPQYDECVLCVKEDGSWDEAEVFNYLEKKYW
jgi:hypothetical protein